jgi:hypothetical protein
VAAAVSEASDGRDPGPQRGHDAWLAVAVRRDHSVGQARHLDDRPQLGVGELLVDGMIHLGQHAARRADLDHGCAAAQLFPDCAHAFGRAVGQPERPVMLTEVLHPRQRVAVQVAMAACGAEHGAGRVDRRPVE